MNPVRSLLFIKKASVQGSGLSSMQETSNGVKFSLYFILISYLVAGAGLLALSLTDAISPLFIVGMGCIVFLNLFLNIKGRTFSISKTLWNIVAVIILAASLADYFFISPSLIEVSTRFLTILMIVKLFDLKTNRDYAVLYVLAFFQLLAASASTVSLSFLFVLALYILTGIWALTIFNLKREWEEKSAIHKEIPRNILDPFFFLATAGLAIFSLIITLSLFFVIPRMAVGFLPKTTADIIKVSGFSEKVDFGELGPIKLDPTIVMRVGLQPPLPPPLLKGGLGGLYFRGVAFDTYNGTQWQQTIKKLAFLQKNQDGVFAYPTRYDWEQTALSERQVIKQVILLEPIETNVLFATSFGTGIAGNFRNITADNMGSFYLPAPLYSRIEYTAYSVMQSPLKGLQRQQGSIKNSALQYLQLPIGYEEVALLARDITISKKTAFEKAAAIEEYLKKNYRYTLTPRKSAGKNPIEDFLFYTKEGYCEQYATAFAILLRVVGIPTRLVTGFLPGEWNSFGNYFIVRQKDAHSWVEAFMPGFGWTTFDPTPSAEAAGAAAPATSRVTLYIDSMRWRWNRYIVNYSFSDQATLARSVEDKTRSLLLNLKWQSIRKGIAKPKKETIFLGVIVVAIILTTVTVSILRQEAKPKSVKTPFFYKALLKVLAKKGKIKQTQETPLEFANAIALPEVEAITKIYYDVRFGGYKLTDREQHNILIQLIDIKKRQI
ncbi:MAG: hypothetical protein A3G39_03285 [Deltaproteobacteria bacterium RIFCSPLOWO2_12_FULL_43_16]|nr:MAG: hypothetical protein A2Z89_06760 [Deltaproteobacteria bacterium GWA2_43_19]OGQ10412.1 MAG: hypothetical protein A3D30_08840 [Deltaproteobacteria bacterium RIFCSPHIGHO2_02_FULL_43_33]OGQ59236.1 MAG: hypothetical protein A3G39_03285 [Deltaproteobacteria bacterium RIFCSPLOWO2_12_FULL_43_16]HBR18508.1 hypothetical protein [Deltaproteobacteria bacterium]